MAVKLAADTKQFDAMMISAQQKMTAAASKLTSIGTKMSMAFTLPLTLIAHKAVSTFSDFDDAMTKSTSIMTGVTNEMRTEMENLAKSISSRSVTSAKDLAESYYFLASAGMDAKQSMMALATVEKFSVAGAFDMATATDLLTDSQMALGIALKDPVKNMKAMKQVSDALVLSTQQSNATTQQFAEALTADAGVASRQLGMELSTLMAILNAYAGQSKKGAEGGNLAGRAFRLLTKAARENADQFRRMNIEVINKATGEYNNFIDIIEDMEKAFQGMTGPQKAAALEQLGFAALAQKSILPLIGLSKEMKEWEKAQKSAGGVTERVANKQMKSFASQMKILKNQINLAAESIGKLLVPYIKAVAGVVKAGLKWWSGLDVAWKKIIVAIGVFVGVLGPAILMIGTFVSVGGWMVGVLGTIAGGISAVVASLTAFAGILGSTLLGPIALATAAIIAFYYVILRYTKGGQKALEELAHTFGWWGDVIAGVIERAKQTIAGIADALNAGEIRLAVRIFWAAIQVEWAKAMETLAYSFAPIYDSAMNVFNSILLGVTVIAADIAKAFKEAMRGAVNAAAFVAEHALGVAHAVNAIDVDKYSRGLLKIKAAKEAVNTAAATPEKFLAESINKQLMAPKSDIGKEATANLKKAMGTWTGLIEQANKKSKVATQEKEKADAIAAAKAKAEKSLTGMGLGDVTKAQSTEFQQVNLSRYALAGANIAGVGEKQEVRAKGVEDRLDSMIELMRDQQIQVALAG